MDGLNHRVIRSGRKTVSIEIRGGELIVRAPQRMSEAAIRALIERRRSWIEKHLSIAGERRELMKLNPPCTGEEIRELRTRAKTVLPQRVAYYAPLVGVDYGRITIRCQRTRWGSCSARGDLSFNCALMLLPDEIADSIVVHELCHIKHMDHSHAFYAEVERVFPGYQRCREWLGKYGAAFLARLH